MIISDSSRHRLPRMPTHGISQSIVVGIAIGLALVCAACSSAGRSREAGKHNSTGSAASVVAQAEVITKQAERQLLYFPSAGYTSPEGIRAMTKWLGSTAPAHPAAAKGKTVVIVSCGATTCNEIADADAKLAEQLGMRATALNESGSGTVQNMGDAMSSAIALHPAAIIGIAASTAVVGPQLAQAKKQGIVTVSTADPAPTGGDRQYAAAANFANADADQLLGYGVIAESKGHANVIAIDDHDFTQVVRSTANLSSVLHTCSGCRIKVVNWQVTDAVDAGKAAAIIQGSFQSNPAADTLVMPYTAGLPAVIAAVRALGRHIKIYVNNADELSLPALKRGEIVMSAAADQTLVSYQVMDQVLRGLGHDPYIQPAQLPYVAHLYNRSNLPDGNTSDFQAIFDYRSVYEKLWGLSS